MPQIDGQKSPDYEKIISACLAPLGEEVQFFIRGSRRFGYSYPLSDLDVFIYVPKVFIESPGLIEFLAEGTCNGVETLKNLFYLQEFDEKKSRYHPESVLYKTYLFGLKVDLIIFEGNLEAFTTLREMNTS